MKETVPVEAHETAAGVTAEARHEGGKFLTFRLSEEEYGLEILKVKEIIGVMQITRVPRTPACTRGVINLRGKVIPVISLREKFGMEHVEDTEQTCIIVVDVALKGQASQMGILVDSVSEVLDIQSAEIEDAPEFGSDVNTEVILGIGKVREKVIMLLDIDRVLAGTEPVLETVADL